MADWLTHQAKLAQRRLDLFAAAEKLSNLPLEGDMSTILTDDDKAELLTTAIQVDITAPDAAGMLYLKVEFILRDKIMEVLPIVESERQQNPINGDGGNYRLERVREKIIKHFNL